jgi:hypothetical protein
MEVLADGIAAAVRPDEDLGLSRPMAAVGQAYRLPNTMLRSSNGYVK